MVSRLDARQSRQRALLDQLSNNTDVKLDTLLNLANDELTQPLRLRQSNPTNLRLNIDSISVATVDGAEGHGRSRTIQPIQGVLPSFTPGYIEFPSASGGSIVAVGLTLAASYTLTVASGNWIKVGVALNTDGQIVLTFGAVGASESAAGVPEFETGTLSIGYVSLQNVTGTIQNVTGTRIYQFSGGGGGSGSGGSGIRNYLEAWYDSNKTPTVNNGGVSQAGNRTAPDNVWASPNTSQISIVRDSVLPLRGLYSYQINGSSGGAGVFVESPVFVLDRAELDSGGVGSSRHLTVAMDVGDLGVNTSFLVELVIYSSAGVFQGTQSFGDFQSGTTGNRPVSFTQNITVVNVDTTSKIALRIVRLLGSGACRIDRIAVTPDQPNTNGRQSFSGQKVFLQGVQTLNQEDPAESQLIDVIPVGETRLAGRLLIGAGRTIENRGDLTVVGAITGTGTLTGSGTITSI